MDRPLLMTLVILFLALLLILMAWGWRNKQKGQAGIPLPRSVPGDLGAELLVAEALYVASTIAQEPLNRITVAGLGYRARASVRITERGLAVTIPGQNAFFIAASDIVAVERATCTIDRVVEQGGMILIRWALRDAEKPSIELDSYFRLADPAVDHSFFDSVRALPHHSSNIGGRS